MKLGRPREQLRSSGFGTISYLPTLSPNICEWFFVTLGKGPPTQVDPGPLARISPDRLT